MDTRACCHACFPSCGVCVPGHSSSSFNFSLRRYLAAPANTRQRHAVGRGGSVQGDWMTGSPASAKPGGAGSAPTGTHGHPGEPGPSVSCFLARLRPPGTEALVRAKQMAGPRGQASRTEDHFVGVERSSFRCFIRAAESGRKLEALMLAGTRASLSQRGDHSAAERPQFPQASEEKGVPGLHSLSDDNFFI